MGALSGMRPQLRRWWVLGTALLVSVAGLAPESAASGHDVGAAAGRATVAPAGAPAQARESAWAEVRHAGPQADPEAGPEAGAEVGPEAERGLAQGLPAADGSPGEVRSAAAMPGGLPVRGADRGAVVPVRVMPLGDSITDGCRGCTSAVPGAYRTHLEGLARADDVALDFVGSRRNGPDDLGDHDHEGHPGHRIDELRAGVDSWVPAARPDVVLLHAGTNDMVQNHEVATAPSRLRDLAVRIGDLAPEADVFVATLFPSSHPVVGARIRQFNLALPGLVQALAAQGRRVHLVDIGSVATTAHLGVRDQVHPSAAGHEVMAVAWYAAMTTHGTLPPPAAWTWEGPRPREADRSAL